MADNVAITAGSGTTIACDEVADGTLGTVKVQIVKVMDGTLDSTNKMVVDSNGRVATLATMTDGTNTPAVKAASTAAAATDKALVVAISPNNYDFGSGTGGSHTQRVIMDSSQLSSLATTSQAMSAGYQLVANPTDQPVANKIQSQSDGSTVSRVVSAATTNATSLKASAGNIFSLDLFNVAAYDIFVKFYNKASAPTVGTDTPVWTIPIKSGTGYSRHFLHGLNFATGIAYAITKLQADSDTTAVAASDVTGIVKWI